ncbi:MAG: amino acid permease [Simkania negevensis]|nr:amino acid permease [Simkania negevensis]
MPLFESLKRPFSLSYPTLSHKKREGLGTLSGVYLPSLLQMLGVILFMRLSWITGHLGLFQMNLLILFSSSILFITGLSMTSIVTNMKMGTGGSYYIISRSLGMEMGSAIGILLTIAQLTTVAISVSGFALSLQELFPHFSLLSLQVATLLFLTLFSTLPVNFSLKVQGGIFLMVIGALASIFLGEEPKATTALPTSPIAILSFWSAFALFFPAATGIESGMAMSGDLKNPSRSLILGTMASVLTAYIIYIGLASFLSFKISPSLLMHYPLILHQISRFSLLFLSGVWGATLSNAIGGMLTAPRTLQALAKDKILPSFLAKGIGKLEHPRNASLLVISLATLLTLLSDLNHLLPVLSMVCLIIYALINFVAFFESLLRNPSWRPLFHTPLILSFSGLVTCLVAMFMISPGFSFITLLFTLLLCLFTIKRKIEGNWDDLRYSIFSFFASTATNKLLHLKKNPKSWRPNILVIIDAKLNQPNMIHFAHAINQAKGFLTYATTFSEEFLKEKDMDNIKSSFYTYFDQKKIPCFFHGNTNNSSHLGIYNIIQNYGLGPLQPNTVFLTPCHEKDDPQTFCDLLLSCYHLKKNLLLLQTDETDLAFRKEEGIKTIDLWWGGKYHANFEMALALAYILQSGFSWKDAKIRIKTIVRNEVMQQHMNKLFEKYHPVLRFKDLSFHSYIEEGEEIYPHIAKHAEEANLTFLGLRPPEKNSSSSAYLPYYLDLTKNTKQIRNIAYILAGETMNFQKIFT